MNSSSTKSITSTNPVLRTLGLEEADPEEVFEIQRKEGAGAFGRVFQAVYRSDRSKVAALKVIPVALEAGQRGEDIEHVRNEIQFLRECQHPNVVAFYGAYYKDNALWVAMEYCGGGSVGDLSRQRKLQEHEIAVILRGALVGLAYLHARKKIHRDIKGGNILLTSDGFVKIADFGVSAQLRDTMSRRGTFVGTPYWMSPEMIQESEYDYKSDIWSLGITAIELADQKPPLFDEHPMRVLIQIPRNPSPTLQQPHAWSKAFIDFVQTCLTKNPKERPSATECLQHPFIRRVEHIERVFSSSAVVVKTSDPVPVIVNMEVEVDTSVDSEANTIAAAHGRLKPAPVVEKEQVDEEIDEIAEEIAALDEKSLDGEEAEEEDPEQSEASEREEDLLANSTMSTQIAGRTIAPTQKEPEEKEDDLLQLSVDESFNLSPGEPNQVEAQKPQLAHTHSPPTSPTNPIAQYSFRSKSVSGSLRTRFYGGDSLRQSRLADDMADLSVDEELQDPLTNALDASFARMSVVLSSSQGDSSRFVFKTTAQEPQTDEPDAQVDAEDMDASSDSQSDVSEDNVEPPAPATPQLIQKPVHPTKNPSEASTQHFIGGPFRVSHNFSVKYNSIEAKYEGAPTSEGWSSIHQQFGIPLHQMRCRSSSLHHHDVPALVQMLRRELVQHDGLKTKHIYRISPDVNELQRAKNAINSGQFSTTSVADPHVYASLIKHWLRDLPSLLLDAMTIEDVEQITAIIPSSCRDLDGLMVDPSIVASLELHCLQKLPLLERRVLEWLLDHLLEVIAYSQENCMTAESLAVVLAPNLYRGSDTLLSPLDATKRSNQLTTVLRLLLSWRQSNQTPSAGTAKVDRRRLSQRRKASSVRAQTLSNTRKASLRPIDQQHTTTTSDNQQTLQSNLDQRLQECVYRLSHPSDHALRPPTTTMHGNMMQKPSHQQRFVEFQRAILQTIRQYAKRPDEREWAVKTQKRLVLPTSPVAKASEKLQIPLSLRKYKRWIDAAMSIEQFTMLLQQEQALKIKLDKYNVVTSAQTSTIRSLMDPTYVLQRLTPTKSTDCVDLYDGAQEWLAIKPNEMTPTSLLTKSNQDPALVNRLLLLTRPETDTHTVENTRLQQQHQHFCQALRTIVASSSSSGSSIA